MTVTKKGRSITIDKQILTKGEYQAKKESRSLSSLIEFLLNSYLTKIKEDKNNETRQ